jgi:hypothetical protein
VCLRPGTPPGTACAGRGRSPRKTAPAGRRWVASAGRNASTARLRTPAPPRRCRWRGATGTSPPGTGGPAAPLQGKRRGWSVSDGKGQRRRRTEKVVRRTKVVAFAMAQVLSRKGLRADGGGLNVQVISQTSSPCSDVRSVLESEIGSTRPEGWLTVHVRFRGRCSGMFSP